jgi:chromosome segregation ATPase
MAKPTIAQLNAQLQDANAEIERLKLELTQARDLLEIAETSNARLTKELDDADRGFKDYQDDIAEDNRIIAVLQEELAIAREAVKKANLISAKKFDEVRPEPTKYRDGAVLPNMADLVKAINTLF